MDCLDTDDLPVDEDTIFICSKCSATFTGHQVFIEHYKECVERYNGVREEFDDRENGNSLQNLPKLLPIQSCHIKKERDTGLNSTGLACVAFANKRLTDLEEVNGNKEIERSSNVIENFDRRGETIVYECKNCHMTFANTEYLSRHLLRCKNDNALRFKCETCNRGFTTKGSLELHINTVHLKKKKFGCNICGKSFTQKHILKIHIDTHYNNRNFQCKVCGKTFVQKSNLTRHERIHEAKNFGYICKYCGRIYSQNKYLQTHVKAHHSNTNSKEGTKITENR